MLIGIDPGHGGNDPGAIGSTGLKEKSITLALAQKLVWYLQQAGYQTMMTRDSDKTVELDERAEAINKAGCDYAISVHVNSSVSQEANYVSTYIQTLGGEAERLANAIQNQLFGVGWPDGGVRVSNLYINRMTKMPSCLCEIGFLSNPQEENLLTDPIMQDLFAAAIARGVTDLMASRYARRTASIV